MVYKSITYIVTTICVIYFLYNYYFFLEYNLKVLYDKFY